MGGKGSGSRGKPTAQLLMHGTYRDDRHGDRIDHLLFDGFPEKPEFTDEDASELWDKIAPQLKGSKIATEVDGPMMEAMCRFWSLWRETMRSIEQGHIDHEKGSTIAAKYWRQFSAIASKFGFSPADRLRLSTMNADRNQDDNDPLNALGIVG